MKRIDFCLIYVGRLIASPTTFLHPPTISTTKMTTNRRGGYYLTESNGFLFNICREADSLPYNLFYGFLCNKNNNTTVGADIIRPKA